MLSAGSLTPVFAVAASPLAGGRSTRGLGRYGNFDGIGRIFGQVFKLVRNDIAVFVLDRNGDINVLGLPGIKAVKAYQCRLPC